MFDLLAFDTHLDRRRMQDHPGDDTLLSQVLREPKDGAITILDTPKVVALAALFGLILAGPNLFGTAGAGSATATGLTQEELATHLQMPANDPRMIAMFGELDMV